MLLRLVLLCILWSTAALGHAAQFQVGAGSTVDFGDARVNFACADLQVNGSSTAGSSQLTGIDNLGIGNAGSFLGGSAQLSVAGNVVRNGAFTAGSSTVSIVDACERTVSQVSGATTFHNLSVTSNSGKTLALGAGDTTTVTGHLTLQGAADNLLRVRSSIAGTTAQLSATTQQSIDYVDAADNRAVGAFIAYGRPETYHSQISGPVFRWFYLDQNGGVILEALGDPAGFRSIPSLSAIATVILAMLLFLASALHLRRRSPGALKD